MGEQRKKIRIEVEADVFGNWCAHRAVGSAQWTVSHVPSGHGIGILLGDGVTYDCARAIAEALSTSPVNHPRVMTMSGAGFMIQQIVAIHLDWWGEL